MQATKEHLSHRKSKSNLVIHSFTPSFHQRIIEHLLWPGMVLGARSSAVHKTPAAPFFLEVMMSSCYCWGAQEWGMFPDMEWLVAIATEKGRGVN